jgi:P-type Mg2+ transporter
VLVIRTRRFMFRTRPGHALLAASLLVVAVVLALPWLPIASIFGIAPVPPRFLAALAVIVALCAVSAELVKRRFYRARLP